MSRNVNATAADGGGLWIDDPETGERVRVGTVRSDLIGQLWTRGAIDETQRHAGNRLAAMFERMASVGYGSGIDLAKGRVDGGGGPPDVAALAIAAASDLVEVHAILGAAGYRIMSAALADGLTFRQISRQEFGRRDRARAVSAMVESALETLAIWWGMVHGPVAERRRREMEAAVDALRQRHHANETRG